MTPFGEIKTGSGRTSKPGVSGLTTGSILSLCRKPHGRSTSEDTCQPKGGKDRMGRTLGYDEREEYQHIIWALIETKRLMSEIDASIENHGGWPLT